MPIEFLIAPYDAATRYSGPARSLSSWRSLLKGKTAAELPRESGAAIPPLVEHWTRTVYEKGAKPVVVGGDHSLTYSALCSAVSRFGSLSLVHFDAHHDAYPGGQLNHYTVFTWIKERLPVNVYGVGYRHDASGVPDRLTEEVQGPTYISVDLDYFDPDLVTNVTHRVPGTGEYSLVTFEESLQRIVGPVIGADILEWHGAQDGSREFRFVQQVQDRLIMRMNT
ncbi:MAG: arginase family protein [Myxococcota bacterium]